MQDAPLRDAFFDLSPSPALVLGADGTIAAANRAWERLGYEPNALVGRSLKKILRPSTVDETLAWLTSGDEKGAAHVADLRASGGTWLTHELRVSALADDRFAVVAQPRQLSEEELREQVELATANWQALSSALADFVVTADSDGVVQTLNRDPPGLAPDALIGRPDSFFMPISPDERPALRERFARVVATGESLTYETRVTYPDGSVGNFQSRLGPIRGAKGIIGVVLVTRDITLQRRAEAARRVAEKSLREYMFQLERSNSELERFASVASHDLQEPLRKIQAFSERLSRKYAEGLPQTGQDYIARMQDAARRMQNLINDLLMFSRLSTKGRSNSEIDLDKLLASVVSDLEVRIEESGGKVECGPLPTIEGDRTRMRQLFQNLIANAIKFRRAEAAPVVTISAEVEGEGAAAIATIRVVDNGIGIEPRYRERIFGIFERLHGRGKYDGTGIGLAICRKICEQHGGSIDVADGGEHGTAFIIKIPVQAVEEKQGA